MLLMVIGFYQPILDLVDFSNFWQNISLGFVFALGVLVGFIIFSKIRIKLSITITNFVNRIRLKIFMAFCS
jgi:uncharacterized membrane protein